MNNPVLGDFSRFVQASGEPACRARIKQIPADFQVDEVLGFEPTGSGEHLYLRVRKRDQGTPEVAGRLARLLGVQRRDIGYSGMKDRRAVSSQWFSVPFGKTRMPDQGTFEAAGLELLDTRRNLRKLRLGSHRANQFRICLRDLHGDQEDLENRVARVKAQGVPNYFGPQRLGKQFSNVVQAQDYFRSFDELREESGLPRTRRSMLLSASRSFLFNLILSRRVAEGNWTQILPGEVFNLNGTRRYFRPDPGGAGYADPLLRQRLDEMDIHLTGLLAGLRTVGDPYLASDSVAQLEEETIAAYPVLTAGLDRLGVQASRRPLRLKPEGLQMCPGDEGSVVLEFSLGAGGYATAVLRELVCFDGN